MNKIGSIYKITNIINNKVYIGQTKQNYLKRFIQHKSHARTNQSNHKLARALRKYGDENFIIELIEECSYQELDEREKYQIDFYHSTEDEYGYNIKTGGQTNSNYYELENQEQIIEYYYTCHNQIQTCKKFGITDYKFRQLLTRYNLPTDRTNYGKHNKKRVKIVELNKEFDSEKECAKYFIDNNLCKTKKIECAHVRIADSLNHGKKYCGYTLIEL